MSDGYIHAVVSHDDAFIYLITAYPPDKEMWEPDLKTRRSGHNMKCPECGASVKKGFTTSVTDMGKCLIIVRNVPCYKCDECNEIIYTADVVQHLEGIIEAAQKLMQQISIIDYSEAA